MKRVQPGHTVLAEAGIFNSVGLSRWAKSQGLNGYYLHFKRSLVTNDASWFLYQDRRIVQRLGESLDWAMDHSSYFLGVDTWGRIEGLSDIFVYSTLKEFKNHYPNATIMKVY